MGAGFLGRKLRLWAVVDGTEMEVAQFGADYQLNTIPTGSIQLPLGRRVGDLRPHPVHSAVKRLRNKKPVQVFAEFKAHGAQGNPPGNAEDPPDGQAVLVFDGYTTGPGYERMTAGAGYSIGMEGWLADLNFSSALSKASHPTNPADLAFPTVLRLLTPSSAASVGASGGLTGDSLAGVFLGPAAAADFWANGMKKWFEALAAQDHLAELGGPVAQALGALGGGLAGAGGGGRNDQALAALARMTTGSLGSPALAFDLSGAGAAQIHIVRNITTQLAAMTLESVASTTMWDNLIGMANEFMFAVAPGVERAAVVPYNPVLRDPYKTIFASEYDDIKLSGDMPRVLRAVGLFGSRMMDGGPPVQGDPVPYKEIGIGGWYEPAGGAGGQVILRQAPGWLAGLAPEVYLQSRSKPTDLVVPTGPDPKAPAAAPQPAPADVFKGLNQVVNRFAQAAYATEVLKFRSGTLVGKFRTDVAPGSVVKVETAGERFVGPDDQFGQELYAAVTRVSLFADGEGQKASTTFGLAHHRAPDENTSEATSMSRHPLYATTWKGGPLRK